MNLEKLRKKIPKKMRWTVDIILGILGFFSTYFPAGLFIDAASEIFSLGISIILSFLYLIYLFPFSLFNKKKFDLKSYLLWKLLPGYILAFILVKVTN